MKLAEAGKRQVRSLLIGRRHALAQALRGLDHSEVECDRRCRLCDEESCPDETCPMVVV